MGDVRRPVCIAGLGTMGRSLAKLYASKDFTVKVISRTPESGKRGLDRLMGELKSRVDKGKLSQDEYSRIASRITLAKDVSEFADAEIIVEAIYEEEKAKEEFYSTIETKVPEGTVIATNTSSLSIDELSHRMRHPSRFIGMHFFNPVPAMKLVEVIRGHLTSDETNRTVVELARKLGKTPVEVNDAPGFAMSRVFIVMINEAVFCLYEGVGTPQAIDEVMKLGAGHPMGPLEVADLLGLDIVLHIMDVLHDEFKDSKYRACPLLRKMVAAGELGRKTGRGFYSYE